MTASRISVSGTILAFDFGERYIGVAVGETELGVAHPLTTIDARVNDRRFEHIDALIREWRPALLLVGLPLSLEGGEHELSRRAQRFARQLEGRFNLPVRTADERLSSAEAALRLGEIGRGDRASKALEHPVAAQIILQSYFDEAR